MRYLFVYITLFVISFNACSQILQRNKLKVQTLTRIARLDSLFAFEYKITNEATSEQKLDEFTIETGDKGEKKGGTISNLTIPEGWSVWTDDILGQPVDATAHGIVVCVAEDSTANYSGLMVPPKSAVEPGSSVILQLHSKGFPSIKRFWARGWSAPLTEHQYDSLRTSGLTRENIMRPWYDDAYQGSAVVPGEPVQQLEPLAFVELIISYKHQSFSLGWIKNQGIATSLDQKLDNAKDLLEKKNNTAAKNILQAFANEVEAQKDKHLTSEAYALLKFNAEYLISKLK